MSEHLIINDTFAKVCEIMDKNDRTDIDKLGEIVQEIKNVEIKGIEKYAQQFQAFIKGFPGVEAPYIFAGMKCFLDAALSSPPFTDPKVRQKYDMLLETLEKGTLRVVITQKAKREP